MKITSKAIINKLFLSCKWIKITYENGQIIFRTPVFYLLRDRKHVLCFYQVIETLVFSISCKHSQAFL